MHRFPHLHLLRVEDSMLPPSNSGKKAISAVMNSLYFYVEDTRYWQCRNCRTQARLHAMTFFHGSKLARLTGYQTMFHITGL